MVSLLQAILQVQIYLASLLVWKTDLNMADIVGMNKTFWQEINSLYVLYVPSEYEQPWLSIASHLLLLSAIISSSWCLSLFLVLFLHLFAQIGQIYFPLLLSPPMYSWSAFILSVSFSKFNLIIKIFLCNKDKIWI